MNIPSWATVAYRWGSNVCYSNGVKFAGYNGEQEIFRGQWGSAGTQQEVEWTARMKRSFSSFKAEPIILIEENE
jgi:hypothetical protein